MGVGDAAPSGPHALRRAGTDDRVGGWVERRAPEPAAMINRGNGASAPRIVRERERMVDEQLAGRGVTDPRVLAAMRRVPRHLFVEEALRERAYGDHPL